MPVQPQVTVLMAVFNGAGHLVPSVRSILSQTLGDLELLVVDDGSTDATSRELASLAEPRLRIVRNEYNMGLTFSLNRGVELARGEFIARLDAHDEALPDRLRQQVVFLQEHPAVGIVGTGFRLVDDRGRHLRTILPPRSSLEIRWTSLFASPFLHSAVMLRRDLLVSRGLNYDKAFRVTQDYDLWVRLLEFCEGANLSAPLVRYRLHPDGVTQRQRDEQLANHDVVARRTMSRWLPNVEVSHEHFVGLRQILFGVGQEDDATRKIRPELASVFLDVLAAFQGRYLGRRGLSTLVCREARRAALMLWRVPIQPASRAVLWRLAREHPRAALTLPVYTLSRVAKKVGGSFLPRVPAP
jgi:glycosyltransferase involved in cell wall biosynthesis